MSGARRVVRLVGRWPVWERVVLAALVVGLVLSVPVLVDDSLGAERVESTDTTVVSGAEGSGGVSTTSHCPYGHRPNGTCRACPRRTYYHNGTTCVPVASTLGCAVAYAKVSSWPNTCVPIFCQGNPTNVNLLEWRNLSLEIVLISVRGIIGGFLGIKLVGLFLVRMVVFPLATVVLLLPIRPRGWLLMGGGVRCDGIM